MENHENDKLRLFHSGQNYRAYEYLGFHRNFNKNESMISFRTWAPNAVSVSLVGDFNNWDASKNKMKRISDGGVWECVVNENIEEYSAYKYSITAKDGTILLKSDPYGYHFETRPSDASKIYDIDGYKWHDAKWTNKRVKCNHYSQPMNIYEVHLGSWKRYSDNNPFSYKKLSEELKATLSYRDNNNNMSNTVNKAELDISGQTCKKENYNYQEARMVFENADISKFEYLQDGEDYGIRLEGIEQFISAKNENLNDLETLTGIPKNKLELITLMFNPLKLSDFISFTPDELKVISSTYSSIIEQNTDAKNFKQKSNQNIEIDGNNYIANAYVLEQDEEQLNSLIIALLERIEKDEIILGELDTLQSKFEVYGAYKSDKNLRTLFINSIDAKIEEIKNNNIGQEKTEIAVYVKKGLHRKGIGAKLYSALEKLLAAQHITNLYACVAYPEKEDEYLTFDSVKFHEKMGYTIVGTFHRCAFKFNKCYHMVWLEKILTQTDITPQPVIPFSKLNKALINKIVLE